MLKTPYEAKLEQENALLRRENSLLTMQLGRHPVIGDTQDRVKSILQEDEIIELSPKDQYLTLYAIAKCDIDKDKSDYRILARGWDKNLEKLSYTFYVNDFLLYDKRDVTTVIADIHHRAICELSQTI